ncbi:MAG: GDSL-type esterase/lipase family protein [Hespellia sp.]|nr:GDSL-type esterase/lipase family protein [Hespellia sp.]
MKIDKRKVLLLCMVVAVVILGLFAVVRGVEKITTKRADTREGLELIKAEESADMSDIENRIKKLDSKKPLTDEEKAARTPKEIFANSVVFGDSIAASFVEYDKLNTSSVVAESGLQANGAMEYLDTVAGLNPDALFLEFGMNDIASTDGNTDLFIEHYKELLDAINEKMPDTRVFVNAIFPVLEKHLEEEPIYSELDKYNVALKALCDERQITFIDNSDIATEAYFDEDGVHFIPDFYPIWAARMAEVAAL